jgi:hypothetical protein
MPASIEHPRNQAPTQTRIQNTETAVATKAFGLVVKRTLLGRCDGGTMFI